MRKIFRLLGLLALAGLAWSLAAAPAETPATGKPGASGDPPVQFVDATREAGIDFTHVNGGTVPIVIYENVPPGAALFDYDNDGDVDLYVVQSGYRRFPPPKDGPRLSNRLYRNDGPGQDGVPRFVDVTEKSGAAGSGYGMGAVTADIDNDGDQDLYVTCDGPNLLFLNNGDGTFTDITAKAGVGDERQSTSAAFADIDGDGLVDLYVVDYVRLESGPLFCYYENVKSGCSDLEYEGLPNSLYLNLGPGEDGVPRFREVAKERGVLDPKGRGLGLVFGDLNDDGKVDIYVANDGGSNHLFINDGKGFFKDRTLISGTGYSEEGRGQASMGVDIADVDGDGRLDIFTTNFSMETNALYHNEGNGQFSYATAAAGLAVASFLPLGWGTHFFDADLDGDLDLFVGNGHVYDVAAQINPQETFAQKNQLFLNDGKGVFTEVSADAGPGFLVQEVSRGAAFGDVDDDGDMDIYVANNGAHGTLLLNRTDRAGRHSIRARLVGTKSNRDALGARVSVILGDRRLVREVKAGGSYLSSSDKRLVIGLGPQKKAAKLEIRWPSGLVQQFEQVPADEPIVFTEGEAAWRKEGR